MVTLLIITLNIVVYLYQLLFVRQELYFVFQMGLVPYELTHLRDLGPFSPYPFFLSPFTSMFVHQAFWHLLSNMWFFAIFGDNIEDRLGHFGFLLFYLGCGLVAALCHILFHPFSRIPVIGASGAVAGVMGAYFYLFPHTPVRCLFIFVIFPFIIHVPAVILLGYWILIQLLEASFTMGGMGEPGVAWLAHIGGFFTGLFWVRKLARKRYYRLS